jgi:transposase
MAKELRKKILSLGVPRAQLAAFEKAIRLESVASIAKKVDFAERRCLELSDDSNAWRIKCLTEQERARELEQLLAVKEKNIAERDVRIERQSAFIAWLTQKVFGETSERHPAPDDDASNTSGDNGNAEEKPPSEPPDGKPKRGKKKGAKGYGRNRDVGTEPETRNHDIDDEDKICKCGAEYDLEELPGVVSYETHYEEKVVVREHVRRKVVRRCTACGSFGGIKKAKKPPQIFNRTKYSVEFWRSVIEEKYWLQRPLNRFRRKLKSLNCVVCPGTLIGGLHRFYKARIFEVVYEEIVDRSRIATQRHMDETGWKVFAEVDGKDSSRWYLWVSQTSDVTVFILDPRKSNEVIADHLDGVSEGVIICDRAAQFPCFAKKNPGFIIAFCWVHQRRDLIKLKNGYPKHATWAESWRLRIDAIMTQNDLRVSVIDQPDEFKAQDAILRNMIDDMKKTIDEQLADKSLKEEQLACLRSLEHHWPGLTIFVDRPHVPMSNNAAERALREAVIGRKLYYGSRAHWSGMQTAWLFTIYATLEQNNIDPHAWMLDYLNACAKNNGLPPAHKELQKFLPWNYKKSSNSVDATSASDASGELNDTATWAEPGVEQSSDHQSSTIDQPSSVLSQSESLPPPDLKANATDKPGQVSSSGLESITIFNEKPSPVARPP